jgi:hypothetical protein
MKLGSSTDLASLRGTPAAKEEREEKKTLGPEVPEQPDLFVRAQRRKLPDERKSVTHKFSVAQANVWTQDVCDTIWIQPKKHLRRWASHK